MPITGLLNDFITQDTSASPTGAAPGETADAITLFITFTIYGTWLPGDRRGWRKWKAGQRQPQLLLEHWYRERMQEQPVVLNRHQRKQVETVIREHAAICGWVLHAVSARSNHVHVAVTAREAPTRVRDQLKANATRVLRQPPGPVQNDKVWTKGGDIEFLSTADDLEHVVLYILEAQDRREYRQCTSH